MKSTLSERLKHVRDQFKLTQEEFANKLNVSKAAYVNFERGTSKRVNKYILDRLTKMSVNPSWLLFGEGDMLSDGDKIIASEKKEWKYCPHCGNPLQ